MAKQSFKCPKCDRSFSMAAHLGRHKNTIHGPKGGRKAQAKAASRARTRKGKRGRPKGSGGKATRVQRATAPSYRPRLQLSGSLLRQMQVYHNELMGERNSLDVQIDGITRAIQAMGATVPVGKARPGRRGGKVGRPVGGAARTGSLRDYIGRVLRQHIKPMSPQQIAVSVVKAGFKTTAKDVTKAVSNTLPQVKSLKRVGFGLYTFAGAR